MRFSACWIVKNEAENIRASIESVKDCAEELIVVDTGSTDGTIAIARECGAKVERFRWIDDFSAAKNYALSLASGEFVIILDGDEYFDPPLNSVSGEALYRVLKDMNADVLQFVRTEIDSDGGAPIGHTHVERILRRATIHYENRIHEVPRLKGGLVPQNILVNNCPLTHAACSESVVRQKLERNIKILEAEQRRLSDPLALFLNAQYLMREYMAMDRYDEAAEPLEYLLRHHNHFEAACGIYPEGMLQCFFHIISVAAANRPRFSHKEVYDKSVRMILEYYPATREAIIAELYYQLVFDFQADRFLREIKVLELRLEKLPPARTFECDQVESKIFEQAAEAVHLRRDEERTRRYTLHAMRLADVRNILPMRFLLYSMRNDPPKNIAHYLSEALDLSRPIVAKTLKSALSAGQYRSVSEFLPEEFAVAPATEQGGILGARQMDYAGHFPTQAEPFFLATRYQDIVEHPGAEAAVITDFKCAYIVAYARIMLGEYARAYESMLPYLDAGSLNMSLMDLLLVVAEKAEGELAVKAMRRYEDCMAILDEITELNDVIHTGAVYGADAQMQMRGMKSMTRDALYELYESDRVRPVRKELLDAHEKAAAIFEKNGCVLQAGSSYRLLLAKGREPERNACNLERLFLECGNGALAVELMLAMLKEPAAT